MHIIYVSCMCDEGYFYELFNTEKMPGQQVQKYHRQIVEGLAKNNAKIETVSAPPVSPANCKSKFVRAKKIVPEQNIVYNHLFVLNLPYIKNPVTIISSFLKTLVLIRKSKRASIICDVLNRSVSIGALLAAKITGTPTIGIVTDIPGLLSSNTKKTIGVRINDKIIKMFDKYVFMTDEMKNLIPCNENDYVVIEGQVDVKMECIENAIEQKHSKKVCIYAGGLQRIYGIPYLTEAFLKANIKDAELHIYGSGDFEEELKEICKKNPQIKFLGVQPNSTIVQEELKATLLINPRPINQAFTKYSFPSKNMEYIVSGTPVLTTKLPGMPNEYLPYVYIIEEETAAGLAITLKELLSKPKEELWKFGLSAKKWAMENKNNIVQTKKIINMIERNL